MPAVHAPHTMTVAGKVYQGGEFIPAEAQDAATPEERKALGLPDTSRDAKQLDRLRTHAKGVLGDKYDETRHHNLVRKFIFTHPFPKAADGVAGAHRMALEHMLGEQDHGEPEPETDEGEGAEEDEPEGDEEDEEEVDPAEDEDEGEEGYRHRIAGARWWQAKQKYGEDHPTTIAAKKVWAETPWSDPPEEDEEPDTSPTQQFVDGYFDGGDTPTARLDKAFGYDDDGDPDDAPIGAVDAGDLAFDADFQEKLADDLIEEGRADHVTLFNRCERLFGAAGNDPADHRYQLAMAVLKKMPDGKTTPFDPANENNHYAVVSLDEIDDADHRAAAAELLRVGGACFRSADGTVAVVPILTGGVHSPHGELEDMPGGYPAHRVNRPNYGPGNSSESDAAHAALFDGIAAAPLLAEHAAPKSAKNFGRVSAGENVAIEGEWDPDAVDAYKPATKGWFLLRRGTSNPELADGTAPMYEFVSRKGAGQLVNLPPQYWARMSQGLTDTDADSDEAESAGKRLDKAAEAATPDAAKNPLAKMVAAKKATRAAAGTVASARDLANRVKGMDRRGQALEDAADKLLAMKDDDGELAVPDDEASLAEQERLHQARDEKVRAAGHDPLRDSHKIDWDDPRWKAESDAYMNYDVGADEGHPSAPHYAELHDAIDDLHGDRDGWRDIDTGFDPDDDGIDEIDGERKLRRPGGVLREDEVTPEELTDRDEHAGHLGAAAKTAAEDAGAVRRRHELAADKYADHFQTMGRHLQRVRDAAAAVMPHVADDESRTAALKKVHTLATRHLTRLARASHYKPPDAYQMAWVPYVGKIGRRRGQRIGFEDTATRDVRYTDHEPGERAAALRQTEDPSRRTARERAREVIEWGGDPHDPGPPEEMWPDVGDGDRATADELDRVLAARVAGGKRLAAQLAAAAAAFGGEAARPMAKAMAKAERKAAAAVAKIKAILPEIEAASGAAADARDSLDEFDRDDGFETRPTGPDDYDPDDDFDAPPEYEPDSDDPADEAAMTAARAEYVAATRAKLRAEYPAALAAWKEGRRARRAELRQAVAAAERAHARLVGRTERPMEAVEDIWSELDSELREIAAKAAEASSGTTFDMAWVPYRAVRKPKTVGKAKGDQIGWREDQTGEIRYGTKKPREIADRPKLAPTAARDGLQEQIKAAVEAGDHAALESLLTQHPRDGLRALLKGTGRGAGGKTKAQITAALLEHARGVQSWHGFAPAGGEDEPVGGEERSAATDVGGDGREDVVVTPAEAQPVPDAPPVSVAPDPTPDSAPEVPPDATPREAAELEDAASAESAYAHARDSAVPNLGEDLKGSARHRANEWRGLADAEASGAAEDLVTRDNLLKAEPHDLMATIQPHNALPHLAAHLALNAFPATPGDFTAYLKGGRTHKPGPKTAAELRAQYYDAFKAVKAEAEKAAAEEIEPDKVRKRLLALTTSLIRRFRGTPTGSDAWASKDPYNPVANELVKLSKALEASYRPKATTVQGRVADFVGRVAKAYPTPTVETLDRISRHVQDVIEGDSFNKTFGTVGQGPKRFDPADAYVATAERKGGRVIDAATVKAAERHMIEVAGLRGVQFGNYVTDDERRHHLTKSAEALADLADVMGIPDSAISLGGRLGLAIGARGRAGALAHYEPDTQVINLTRAKGVGSLAHEWGHALDHMIEGFAAGKMHSARGRLKDIPTSEAMAAVKKAWADSGYAARLRREIEQRVKQGTLPKNAMEYWASPEEMFARTFERHAQQKLHDADRENTYLTGLRKDGHPLWPNEEESRAIGPAMETLFAEIRKAHFPATASPDAPTR